MATRKTRLHRLTAHVLLFSLAADPFALGQIQAGAAARNGFAADLRTAALPGEIDRSSPTAVVPATATATAKDAPTDRARVRREVATSFVVPTTGPAGSGEGAATCAESLTQRRAPLVSLVKTLLWPPNHPLVDVGLDVNVTAPCEGRVTTRVAVFADEPDEDQTGDGNVPGDARIDGTTLYLRSERQGDADGRVYLVLATSMLPDGTSGTACATVVVPESRSQADLASVRAQASAAQAYCEANHVPPPSFFELTEGVLALANIPPAVNAGPDQAVDFPGFAVLHGTATDDGRPNGTLSVSWSKVSGPGTVTFSSPGTAETTASFSETGTYTLRLTADDGQFAESDDAVVVVAIANEAPHVDAGPDQEITLPEVTVPLDGSATDDGRPAGSTLTTTWSVLSPAGAAVPFADAHAAQTTATLPGAGEYVLRLTADDGQFAVSDDVRVIVHAQPPPVLAIEDAAVPEGHEGTTAAVVTLTLSYAWSQPVTVDYITEDGTAVAGCDYRTAFGTVTFAPGETTAEVLVPIAGELAPEEDETVRILVGNVSQATLARTEATLTILNDDAANAPPSVLSNRAPADRANGVALPPTLTWSAVDPNAGDVLTHDVHLGTSFATSGQSWARTCPANQGPGPRTAPVAGYDEAGDRLILFGGTGTTDESLWILDNASASGGPSQWTSIPSAGGPVELGHAASAYDAATNRLFVVGGCSGECPEGSDQTWILTNANGLGGTPTWSLLPGAGPGPRIDHAAAIDPATRQLIVFGGSNAGASLGDVWLLNLDGAPAWQELPTNGVGPARSGMSASYDPEKNVLIVFGGRAGTQALSDTWVLSNANGSGGNAQWSRLAPAGTAPPARWGHVAAYDPVTARLVVYGGSTASANPATRFVFRDAWMLTDAAGAGAPEWIRLSPNAGPTGQVQAAGAFSAPENRLVVVGGTSNTSAATDEIWVLSDAIGTLPLVSSDTATSFTAHGLVPSAVYSWRIVSRDDHGAARGSTAWRFTSNAPPLVEAGPDQTITLPTSVVTLNGTGSDDGLPTGILTFAWTASGPGPVAFANASSAVTTATFAAPGTYVLRLTVSDSQLSASDELTVAVLPQAAAGRIWTTIGDFAEGQSLHVNADGDRLQLDATAGAYPFVWIAVSSKGTIVKIDARTGVILGEYFSSPAGQPRNPSRTTVDLDGNVWTANRDGNSIVHIGNEENKQCVDRNGNGVIDTSRRFGDLRPWTNTGGADTDGGVSTAADECILHYTRVSAPGTRHLSVTRDNDVWVSGTVTQTFDLIDGRTGFIKRSEPTVGFGGYGGLMDRNGVIWSARPLLRWDPALPLTGPNGGNWKGFGHDSYGLCIDPQGNVWETALFGPSTGNPATSGTLRKWAPDGTLLGTFGHGFPRAQGCAVDARGDVWVAHVLDGSNTVGHVKNNGAFVGNVTVPSGPTGVAVDLFGKIWTSNHNSQNVSRIDPNAGPIGADGATRIGAVDFTTPNLGGIPYNYSDMTGSTLVGAPREGRWSVIFDSGMAGAKWGLIRWSESRCGDGSLAVRVASSLDGLTFTADQPAESGQGIPVPDGRYLRVTVTFTRATTGESPILYDLSVGTEAFPVPGDDADQPPQVDAGPDQSIETPNEASLSGSACDDGRPSDALDVSWSKVSGPGDVRFSDPTQPKTRARFQAAGSFDAAEDFSETTNPSGPWSYGWKPTRTGAFTPGVPVMYFGMPSWQRTRVPDFGGLPAIAKGPREQTYVFAGSSVFLPAEMLYLHPGSAGQNAVVRWTAPAAGSYRIEGRFQAISTGNPTVDVAILHNATTIFTGNIASFGQATPFALIRNVAAGDVLDFSVGFGNGSFFNDNTGLAVRVAPVDAAGVAGTYVLRLSANDAAGSAQDDVTVTVTTPDCVAPPGGTVGWWPADGHARDLFGGPSATLAGGMGYGAGMAGQAFFFDGVDDAVTIPASPALNVQAFTLEGWVFPTDPRIERPIFEYGAPGAFGVHLWQNLNTAIQRTAGALYANVIDSSGNNHILATGAGVLVPSTWNHVALTYDPASGKARLYANGRLQVELGAGTFVPRTNLPFNIGFRPNGGNRFAGGIDEATIVSRALTAAEIQEIYFAGSLGKCKAINQRPQVDAGADQEVLLPLKSAALAGTVSDDGLPKGVALKYQWTKVSGPGTVTFSAPTALATTATFSTTGDYTLQLEADDSELKGSDSINVSVRPRADLAIASVDVTGLSVDGQTLEVSGTVSATITNLGQGPAARPFTVTFFEDLNLSGALDAGDTVLGSTSLASLDASASSAVSAPVSGHVSFAGNSVYAFADSTNAITESDESNNYAKSGPPCANAPGPRPFFSAQLEWSWSSSPVQSAAKQVATTPMVADLDGDGRPEVIFGSYSRVTNRSEDGYLRVLDGATGAERFTVANPSQQVAALSPPAVGDIDGDGRPEIIAVALSTDRLIAFEHDGTFKWQSPVVESPGWGGAALVDFDGDGQPEILVGRTVLNGNGTIRWKGTGGKGEASTASGLLAGSLSMAADLDGNGIPEVVAGNTAYRNDGTILWQVSAPDGLTAVGNFDADPSPEIVLVGSGQVRLLEHNGAVKWGPVSLPGGGGGGAPVVADIDGDGVPEIGVAGASRFTTFRADGTAKWSVPIQDVSSNVTGASVFDFEGDGAAEVVYADENAMRVYKGTDGTVLFERLIGSCTVFENPVIADVDADGRAEIVVVANDLICGSRQHTGILVFGNPDWVSTRRIWNQHTYHITNVNDDGTIPPRETNSWTKYNSYRQNRLSSGCEFAKPDLTASFVRSAESSGSLILTARIGNGGGSTVAAGVPVSFYDRDPATVGTRITTVATSSALAPGGFVDVSVTVPATTVARPLWVVADDQGGLVGTIDEFDETNNAYNSRLFLSPTGNTVPTVDAGPDQRLVHPQRAAVLDGTATDDGQPLGQLTTRWSVVQRPTGATVTFADATAVDTTATFSAAGTYVLRLTANDGQSTGSDDVMIVVEAANQAPVIDAGPNQAITKQTTALDGTVTDDGLPTGSVVVVQWSKLQGPGTAAFANASAVDTTVTFDQEGRYVLQLSASDSAADGSDTVQIDVAFANAAPVVNAGPDRTLTLPANTLTLTGTATDDGLPLGSTLSVTWSAAVSPGVVTFSAPAALETTATFSDPGVYVLKLTASDGTAKGSDQVQVTVGAAAPVGNAPQVALTAPLDGARVTAPIPVVGSATSDSLASWKLEYRLEDDTTFTRFAAGTTPVVAGPLGTFDPSLLLNGIYEVRLTATDTAGRNSRTSVQVVVKDNLKVGHFSVSFVDLDVPVAGLPIRVTRTYDSRDKGKGDFGIGWRLDLSNIRLAEKEVTGLAFEGTVSSGSFPSYCLQPSRPQVVTVTTPDGEVYEFQPVVSPQCQRFAPIDGATITFQPLPGTNATLTAPGDGFVFVSGAWPGEMELFDGSTFDIYDPEDYVLTLPDGRQFSINQGRGLTQIRDLNGNLLSVSPAGITHSSGRGITFVRDAQGRITQITDPDNHSMTYGYDAAGDLASFTDRETHTTTFTYNPDQPHLLETIKDPRGKQPIRNEYYEDGRIKSHTDAFGKTITYSHDVIDRQEVITDRLGHTRLLEYDDRGNVVREVDANGKEMRRTFDAEDHLLTETNPLGKTTTYTYDAFGNTISITDAEGNRTTFTYNSRGQALTILDPRGNLTTRTYDAQGNLTEIADPLGNVTRQMFDDRGNLLSVTDPEGNITTFVVDSSGNRIREIDALGNPRDYIYDRNGRRRSQTTTRTTPAGTETLEWIYTYDREGRLIRTQDPDGMTNATSYDALGNITATIDKLGRTTSYSYDAMGRQTVKTYPDGTTEQTAYDAENRRISATDRGGRTTRFEYDTLGRLVKTIYPDGAFAASTYDAAGRLLSARDARGNTTQYEHDGTGRLVRLVDALGNQTLFTYDGNENQTSITDANGQTIRFEYDAANRLVRSVFPDGTDVRFAYNRTDHKILETDQAGRSARFSYDDLGRLTEVTDALGQVTRYTYDELGNPTSQTDAKGHTTGFEYDYLGRLVKRILPLGDAESRSYDSVGNLIRRTDFNGSVVSYSYDINDRLVQRSYPDGSSVVFTYTPTGQRATVTDSRGTTVLEYDSRDRLTSLTDPRGRKLIYLYDHQGNRTSLTATIGATTLVTSYSYDARNRLDVVTDPMDRLYSHTYDANGNRLSLAYPNNIVTTYTYNALNRLLTLSSQGAGGTMIQSYSYTLGPAGNRLGVDEADGTRRVYEYDDLYRLTSETVMHGASLLSEDRFTYNPAGNRLTRSRSGPAGPETITYTYDERDRLLSGHGASYSWDANGNLTAKSSSDGAVYVWDLDDRLIRVNRPDGTVIYHAYDADGNRVRTELAPSTGPPVVTEYLIDPAHSLSSAGSLRELSQVVAELDTAGNISAYYVRGDDLLAVTRPGGTRFYHADGLGSIRALTNETGAVTDRYSFSAFGELASHVGSDPNAYLFAGEPLDPNSGFYYLRARWMDPALGRLISSDPLLGNPFDPRSLHRYTYAHDDPINTTDPSGQESLVTVAVTQAIIGGLISGILNYLFTQDFQKSLVAATGGFIVGLVLGGASHWLGSLLAVRSAGAAAAAAGAADDTVIAASKLKYLLTSGGGKDGGFEALGYTLKNVDDVDKMLRYSRTLISEGAPQRVTQHGTKYFVSMKIIGANGREGIVDVVWQLDHGATVYRLITAIAHPFK
jgi:RHS repeat-associated protein